MADDVFVSYLSGLAPTIRPVAERLVTVLAGHPALDAAIKWRRLTFAADGDFDHWVCAVSATERGAALVFHFGSLLGRDEFDASEAKFARRITYRTVDDVDDDIIREILAQALDALPTFRSAVAR